MIHFLAAVQKKTIHYFFLAANVVIVVWLSCVVYALYSRDLQDRILGIPKPLLQLAVTISSLVGLFIVYRLLRSKFLSDLLANRYFPVGIFILAVITRWIWLASFGNVDLQSDFDLYMTLAKSISDTGQIPTEWQWYVSFAPYVIGYSSFLAFLFGIFGSGVLVAQSANVILSSLIAVLLFSIGKKITAKPEPGVIAALLWIGTPSIIALTAFPATELTFITMMLAAIYVCLQLPGQRLRLLDSWHFVIAAILIVLMNEIRPLGYLVLAALVIYIFSTLLISRKKAAIRVLQIGVLLAVYFLSSSGLLVQWKESILGNQIARNAYGFGLYLGLNHETTGSWSEDDSALVGEAAAKGLTAQQFHQDMIGRSMERFENLVQRRLVIDLFTQKILRFWTNPNALLDWTLVSLDTGYFANRMINGFYQISIGLYGAVLLLTLLESVLVYRRRDYRYASRSIFVKALLLAFFAMHIVFDVNARYVIPSIPLLFILAAGGLQTAVGDYIPARTSSAARIATNVTPAVD